MFWKLSLLTSSVATAISVYNLVALTENWGPSFFAASLMFTVVAVLLVGPYVTLGILASFVRSHRVLSITLFVFMLLISVLGTTFLSLETYAYLSRNKALPEGTDLGIFFLGAVQWISAILLWCVMLPVNFYLGRRNPQLESNQVIHRGGGIKP
ncbi:MAG TPA: hypothetical protein DEF45_19540 [Rhodopirellula sp.]|nr:hypothetical protein [Rhodopirellula sp.]